MSEKKGSTQFFSVRKEPEIRVKDVIRTVYEAMEETDDHHAAGLSTLAAIRARQGDYQEAEIYFDELE